MIMKQKLRRNLERSIVIETKFGTDPNTQLILLKLFSMSELLNDHMDAVAQQHKDILTLTTTVQNLQNQIKELEAELVEILLK